MWVFLTGGVFVMAYTLPFAVVLLVYLLRVVFTRPKSFAELRYQRTLVLLTGAVIVAVDLMLHFAQSGTLP